MSLDALAPDQRAVVELVLQQGRGYASLSALLGGSEAGVRERARRGLDRLAAPGDLGPEVRGELADFLLGQQADAQREATRTRLAESTEARLWASAVSAELATLPGAVLPELPAPGPAAGEPAVRARPRPSRDRADRPAVAAAPAAADDGPAPGPLSGPGRSSRLGGALLLGALAIVLVAVVAWLVTRGDDAPGGSTQAASSATTTATVTATATPTFQPLGQIALTSPTGGRAKGAMVLFAGQDSQIAFTVQATNVPRNGSGDAYAVWLTGGGAPHRLGFAAPVGTNGKLGVSGPRQADQAKFAKWLGAAKNVVVSRETQEKATQPGPVLLGGKVPSQGSG